MPFVKTDDDVKLGETVHTHERQRYDTMNDLPKCCYSDCMAVAVTVRDVPQDVRDELAARAARKGQSLQEYLRARLIAEASKPAVDDLIDEIRRYASIGGRSLSVDRVLSDRDADRR